MGRLVVVSNRVADPRKPGAGGLAVAMAEALKSSGGLWFGWSGRVTDGSGGKLHEQRGGDVTLATMDLARADYDAFPNALRRPPDVATCAKADIYKWRY